MDIQSLDDLFDDVDNNGSKNENRIIDDVNPVEVKDKEIPVLSNEEDDTYDIQKELEEKFDELFGPME